MLSLLIFFSISESNPISGCENIASEEIKAGFTLVKTIESNGILCFKGSALLKADKNFVATYAFVSENSASTSTMTKENPFHIGSGDKTTYIKIAPKDPNEKLQISLTGARLSSNSASLFKVGVFSTLKYFQKSISISNTQNLHLVAINEVPFRFTRSHGSPYYESYPNGAVFPPFSSTYNMFETHVYLKRDGLAEKAIIRIDEEPEAEKLAGFVNPFSEEFFYILPTEGAYTRDEVIAYSNQKINLFEDSSAAGAISC